MNKKYKLTKEKRTMRDGTKVFRIQALTDFSDVAEDDYGGFVEREENLSFKEGDHSWIYDDSTVYGKTRVRDNSIIRKSKNINSCMITNSTLISVNGLSQAVIKNTYMYN